MNVLIVSPEPTHSVNAGNRACILSYSELLKSKTHEVFFLLSSPSWAEMSSDLIETKQWWGDHFFLHKQSLLDRIIQIFQHRFVFRVTGGYSLDGLCPISLPSFVQDIVQKYDIDVVIVNYWHLSRIFTRLKNVKNVIFTHDVFANRYAITNSRWLSTKPTIEAKALNRADVVLAIQDTEAQYYRSVVTVPVLTSYTYSKICEVASESKKTLLFLAGANELNAQAIRWFVNDILPGLQAWDKEINILIGGAICESVKDLKLLEGVRLYGKVERLQEFYCKGSICLNPVSIGSGLKIKLIEAASFGLPVICSPHCIQGVPRADIAPFFVASTLEDYIFHLKYLFNADRLDVLSKVAKKYVEMINHSMENAFEIAISSKRESGVFSDEN